MPFDGQLQLEVPACRLMFRVLIPSLELFPPPWYSTLYTSRRIPPKSETMRLIAIGEPKGEGEEGLSAQCSVLSFASVRKVNLGRLMYTKDTAAL